jgi:hypothetical protein
MVAPILESLDCGFSDHSQLEATKGEEMVAVGTIMTSSRSKSLQFHLEVDERDIILISSF